MIDLCIFPTSLVSEIITPVFKKGTKNSKENYRPVSIFFLPGFSFTDTDNSQDSKEREGGMFYSSLSLPPALELSDIYVQFCK